MINEEEFNAWRHLPVTKMFFEYLKQERQRRCEMWLEGHFIHGLVEETHTANLQAQTQAQTLKDIIELDYQAITGEYDHVEE